MLPFRPADLPRPGAALRAVPAPVLFIGAATSTYVGAGLAVALFAAMPSTTVAWWRLFIGALVLLSWRRPWRRRWTRRALVTAALFGVAMSTMNVIFYASIGHLALGTAVSLEFLGPVVVALATGRGWRPRVAALLALAGVAAISGFGLDLSDGSQRLGVVLALSAGAAWAAYILLGRRAAGTGGVDSLAVASAAGALVYLPLAAPTASAALADTRSILMVLGVGVMSTVIPYGLDQVNMGRLTSDAFALLSSLMPATSLLVGLVMLRQVPNAWEVLGLLLVSAAVALAGTGGRHRRTAVPGRRP
ncbi:MAG: EamA family transporter [Actinomyces sp.]|uniref:EamA family transporter n=1 Tax=Actinomyces sp. TaxID=29317 RepID=UPI0026DBC04A|nr:EamA family transporter [Actinomyces sp.]MDO4244354.1 EamA family transporter [Actinomyces sp.]